MFFLNINTAKGFLTVYILNVRFQMLFYTQRVCVSSCHMIVPVKASACAARLEQYSSRCIVNLGIKS